MISLYILLHDHGTYKVSSADRPSNVPLGSSEFGPPMMVLMNGAYSHRMDGLLN